MGRFVGTDRPLVCEASGCLEVGQYCLSVQAVVCDGCERGIIERQAAERLPQEDEMESDKTHDAVGMADWLDEPTQQPPEDHRARVDAAIERRLEQVEQLVEELRYSIGGSWSSAGRDVLDVEPFLARLPGIFGARAVATEPASQAGEGETA